MPLTIDQFTHQVSSSGLMTEDGLRAWLKSESFEQFPSDGEQLARELVKQKKLTKFQASQIYAGKGASLVLGNYVILDKLGQGGMGMVLKAEHKRMKRLVAVKVISAAAMKSKDAVQRFHREVEAAAKLTHPNIVNAHDADEAKGTHFLVMEYVEGSDLSSLVKKSGPLSVSLAIDVILQAARGLEYAHKQGVIHRDIKPANLLLSHEGVIKILDMGLARIEPNELGVQQAELTNTGAILGTIDYMSPEQAEDTKHADARSDIYSLGCSLYYLLAGHAVYTAETIMKKLLAHREATLPSLVADAASVRTDASSVGHALDFVFHKMIAKKASDRYQSMTEVIFALEQCRSGNSTIISQSTDGDKVSGNDLRRFLQEMTDDDPNATITEPAAAVATLPKPTRTSTTEPMSEETLISTDAQTDSLASRRALAPGLAASTAHVRGLTPAGSPGMDKRRIPTAVAIGLASVVLLLGGVITYVKMNRGTLRIEINDPQIEVTVQGTDIVVKDEGQEDIRLKPGEHTLHVKRGALEFDTDTITVKKGETVAVKIELIGRRVRAMRDKTLLGHRELRQALPKPGTTTPSVSPDGSIAAQRNAAKKLLEIGCGLHVFVGNGDERREVRNVDQLPDQEIRLSAIFGNDKTVYRDEHAELFAQFPDLEIFEGGVFEMSAKGVQSLAKLPKLWKVWGSETRFDSQAVEQLVKLRNLTSLHLDTTHLTPTGLAHIGKLVDLRQLGLVGANFDDDALQHLKPLRQLEGLGLILTSVRGPGLRYLVETQSLTNIMLNWQKAGNEGLAAVSQFKRLESISVDGVASITDAGLAHLNDMPRLRELIIANTSITDAGLEHLKSLPALERLELIGTNVTDAGMQHLAELPRLQILWLRNTRVGDAGLDVLKKLPIVGFSLEHTRITDNGLRLLKEFKQLDELGIGESGFTDKGLQELPAIPRLRRFGLRGKKFGPTAWENVGKMTRLEHLDINETNINDEGLAHLTGMTNLVNIELHHTDVTDQGLIQLKNLPKLRGVDCNDSPGVTPAGLQALLDVLPARRGQAASPDRRISEWVLRNGGTVNVWHAGESQHVDQLEKLPDDPINIVTISLPGSFAGDFQVLENVSLAKLSGLICPGVPVTNDMLRQIKDCRELRFFQLDRASVTDQGVEFLVANWPNAEHVHLSGTAVGDAGIRHLAGLTQPTMIILSDSKIADDGVRDFLSRVNPNSLAIFNITGGGARVTDRSLKGITRVQSLQELWVPHTSIANESLAWFAELKSLRSLTLAGTKISDAGAAAFANHPVIEHLNFEKTAITDDGLAELPQSLTSLYVHSTNVTDKALPHLLRLPKLTAIKVMDTKVTKAGMEAWRKSLPRCRIEWDDGVIEPQAAE